ncbi:hypothetical protein [Sporisorium scitamineum]|uniref:DNA-directed RNA polymerase n=2 Tax=Sporisorium scitamineum TaxID=49012 RepID=A0A0F7S3M5_9BASI|nr:hypothetical protein [Sporisorium scitamineum]
MADSVAYDKYMKDTFDEGAIDVDDLDVASYNNTYGAGKGVEYEDDDEYAEEISQEDCWDVIRAFFEEKGLVRHQLDSFNEFMSNTIQELVEEVRSLTLEQSDQHSGHAEDKTRRYEIEFGQIYLNKPTMTESDGSSAQLFPQEARFRNLTYSASLFVDVTQKVLVQSQDEVDLNGDPAWVPEYGKTDVEEQQIFIGKVPIMLKSDFCWLKGLDDEMSYSLNECPYDSGGYFVINGSEKVLIAQERMAANHVYVFSKAPPAPVTFLAEIRSAVEKGGKTISTMQVKLFSRNKEKTANNTIRATLPYIRNDIPIVIVFRALGIVPDREVLQHICYDFNDTAMLEMLKPCIEEAFVIQDRDVALDFIGRRGTTTGLSRAKRTVYAQEILQKEMLPHISTSEGSNTKKAYFFGYMIHRLLLAALDRREIDDRDHFGKKRIDLGGPLMANLFRMLFRKVTRDVYRHLQKCVEEHREFHIQAAVKSSTITNGLRYSLATGNWGDQKKAMQAKAGVSQVLNRFAFASTLSHLRRTNTPIGRDGKIAKPRQLHNTHWGMVCPAETPEGQACGLVKNLSLMATVTVGTPSTPIVEFLEEFGLDSLVDMQLAHAKATKIFVNGVWMGTHDDPGQLVDTLRDLRRKDDISHEVSVVRDIRERELRIYTDASRVLRPVFIVNPNDMTLFIKKRHVNMIGQPVPQTGEEFGWSHLVQEGVIEYLDAEEEESALICMSTTDLEQSREYQARNGQISLHSADPSARLKSPHYIAPNTWTHCEIHPAMVLGICASIIPFPDHNQSPRNV